MSTNKYKAHEDLRNKTKPLIQKAFPSIAMYTRHVGKFYIRRVLEGGSAVDYIPIKIEKAGRCDDWGVLPCKLLMFPQSTIIFPIHIEIETKSGNSILSPDQKKWRDKCLMRGILWFENRDANQTIINIQNELNKRGLVPWTISRKI